MAPPLSWFSPKVEKRPSRIEGRGLHAREALVAGEIVVVKGGHVLTRATRDRIAAALGPAEIQIADDLFLGPTTPEEREGGMMHLNHSCDPNVGVAGQIVFVAMRDVPAGEELTFDYAMTDDEPGEMRCACGAPACRGTITGRDWMRPELQERYRGFFSWHVQRRIAALSRP